MVLVLLLRYLIVSGRADKVNGMGATRASAAVLKAW